MILKEEDLAKVEDEILLTNGWKLNIMMNGRKPEFRVCKRRGDVKKNCDLAKEHSVTFERTKDVYVEETEAMVEAEDRRRGHSGGGKEGGHNRKGRVGK